MSCNGQYGSTILSVLALLLQTTGSFSWSFSRGNVDSNKKHSAETSHDAVSEFSLVSFDSKEGVRLLEKAERMVAKPNTCWQDAYRNLYAGCSEVLASEEQRSQLAWHLGACFQKDQGWAPFPDCDLKSPMVDCLKRLDKERHHVYLEYYLITYHICHHLQSDAFKRQTERLVNELKRSAEFAEEKLEKIQEKHERVLHTSEFIDTSVSFIGDQTQQLAQTSKRVEERVNVVLENLRSVGEQFVKIADSQMELQNGQAKLKEGLDEGMAMLNESAKMLGEDMNTLTNETVEIRKEVVKVGDAAVMKMNALQNKVDDIGTITETSLDKQKHLLESQNAALEILQNRTSFLFPALEEFRESLQQLFSLSHSHQQELIQSHEQLKQSQDDLNKRNKAMLADQKLLASQQSNMFASLDRLFTLVNALLLETRVVKAIFVYALFLCIIYMFTSTKQTYNVRCSLYAELCVACLVEYVVLRYGNGIEQQAWIIDNVRLIFVVVGSSQLLHAFYAYRDYETINHELLQSLIEKVNGMQGNMQFLLCEHGDEEDDDDVSEVDWASWVDKDISEDESEDDVDYFAPHKLVNQALLTRRGYNLRYRRQ